MRQKKETLEQYKLRVIDPISKSYCAAKWYNATIWLGHGQTTSCHHPPAHWIPKEELKTNYKAIHNTLHKKKMRQMMQKGERPQECEYCWKVEDIGRNNISDRVYKTEIYSDTDIEKTVNLDYNEDVNLKTLEISFDRACNFACSYCNPAFSTKWVKDINTNGPYLNIQSDGRGHFVDNSPWAESAAEVEEDNPYVIAFWKWWNNGLSESLQEIRITGGEPLMHKSVWRLFEWFKENPNSNLKFAINSNLVPEKNNVIDKLIKASYDINHLVIYTSAESAAKQSEYIRDGFKYKKWKNNIVRLLEESNVKTLNCMMTINSLCLESITDFMDDMIVLRKKYGFRAPVMTLNILRFPSFQSIAILPPSLKDKFKNNLEIWLPKKEKYLTDGEISHVVRLIDYLDVVKTPHRNTAELPKIYNDFRYFYEQYDMRRNKNFLQTFPSFVDWYKNIPYNENDLKGTMDLEGDPATTDSFVNDDKLIIKDGVGGWNTTADKLGA